MTLDFSNQLVGKTVTQCYFLQRSAFDGGVVICLQIQEDDSWYRINWIPKQLCWTLELETDNQLPQKTEFKNIGARFRIRGRRIIGTNINNDRFFGDDLTVCVSFANGDLCGIGDPDDGESSVCFRVKSDGQIVDA